MILPWTSDCGRRVSKAFVLIGVQIRMLMLLAVVEARLNRLLGRLLAVVGVKPVRGSGGE